jgi:gliding motility-associated-like protein
MRLKLLVLLYLSGLYFAKAQVQFVKEYIPNILGRQINVIPTADGFKVFTLDSFKMSNFDFCGNSLFRKKYYLPASVTGMGDVKPLSNGDIIVLSRKDYVNTAALVLTRISDNGNVLWSYEYGDNVQNVFPYTVSEDLQGNLFLFMNVINSQTNVPQSCVLKTNAVGNVLWCNFYGYGVIWGGGITTSDDGFLFRTGNTLVKLTNNGSIQWSKDFNLNGYYYYAPVEVADGYVFNNELPGKDIAFYKIDKQGNIQWGGLKHTNLKGPISPMQNSGKNIIASFITTTLPATVTIYEFDSALQVIRQYGVNTASGGYALKPAAVLNDGSLLNAGFNGNLFQLNKLKTEGNAPCAAPPLSLTSINETYTAVTGAANATPYAFTRTSLTITTDTFSFADVAICTQNKSLFLGADTLACSSINLVLQNQLPDSFETYLWSTGATTAQYHATSPGTYTLTVTYQCGERSITDSIYVSFQQAPVIGFADSVFLYEDSLLQLVGPYCTQCTYLWSTGDTTISILATDTGWHSLTVKYGSNCSVTDSTKVLYAQCSCSMYIPNAFSPNNDGMNEGFRTYNLCDMGYFEMHVYNRTGENIFTSYTSSEPWYGKYKGKKVQEGMYIYTVRYTPRINGINKRQVFRKGFLFVVY